MTILENHSLKAHHTFGLDVRARYWAQYAGVDELVELLHRFADQPKCFIGEGSNLLFTGDFDGIVLHSAMCRAAALNETDTEVLIEAQSGLKMDELIEQLAAMQLYGLENLSYIPGQVGAAAVQNIGAYGVEVKDCIDSVKTLDLSTFETRIFNCEECQYGYRDSFFKRDGKGRYVITAVRFRVSKTPILHLDYGNLHSCLAGIDNPSPEQVRQAVIAIRKQKLPEVDEYGSAGSFFKNPVIAAPLYDTLHAQYPDMPSFVTTNGYKIPAAWLIEQCGWKDKQSGRATVWQQQPLVIVNNGNATAEDILQLAQQITDSVNERFHIQLEREVEYI